MSDPVQNKPSDFQGLPDITFRQLEVFRVVCHERSYSHGALELRSTRSNVKRVLKDFESAVGRSLFEDGGDQTLQPTEFAQGLLNQMGNLSRSLRHLRDGVKLLHDRGRILRFGVAGEIFRDGLFTSFLERLSIADAFRSSFVKIEGKRFRTSLLNAECDVYFGVGLSECDRLDFVDLGPVSWRISSYGPAKGFLPEKISDLAAGNWSILSSGDAISDNLVLDAFRSAGAPAGEVLKTPPDPEVYKGFIFQPDTSVRPISPQQSVWPCYRFSAALRKHHPYSELKARLDAASLR